MNIRKKVQDWLGITAILEESSLWNKELSKLSYRLTLLQQEDQNLRQLVAEKIVDAMPASSEFIGVMHQQTEARLDQAMNAFDRLYDELRKRH